MSVQVVHEHARVERRTLWLHAHPLRTGLVGNPNVGTGVVFGALAGRCATVSNHPETTASVTSGRSTMGAGVCDLIDTPGVHALSDAISEDERTTRQVLGRGEANLIVQVADARNIRRALRLSAEILADGRPLHHEFDRRRPGAPAAERAVANAALVKLAEG